jgi:hypothetical protein
MATTTKEFPVKVPYTTNPNMGRNGGAVFNKTPSLDYLSAKSEELVKHGDLLYATTQEADINHLVIKASRYCEFQETDKIEKLTLGLEEDIAIIHQGMLAAICFCFPSSWVPRERIGMSLASIHAPVADGERLVKASQQIANTMADVKQGSFRRSIWTIANNSNLSQLPKTKSQQVPNTISDLYFRTEIQTTAPLGDNKTSLFFVKVEMTPLSDIWNNIEQRNTIIKSVNSMSDAVLDYKNLRHVKTLINNNV